MYIVVIVQCTVLANVDKFRLAKLRTAVDTGGGTAELAEYTPPPT